ncbi:MAG: YbhN family protein [Geminicoccaceae bacterium]
MRAQPNIRRYEYAVVISLLAFIAISVAVSAVVGLEEIAAALGKVGAASFLGMVALALINFVLRGLRWVFFCRSLDLLIPDGSAFMSFFAGFSMATTPGKVGELIRLWLLNKAHACRYEHSMGLLLGDRLSDLAAVTFLGIISAVTVAGYTMDIAIAAFLFFLIIVLFARPRFLLWSIGVSYALTGRLGKLLARLRQGIRRTSALFKPNVVVIALGLSLLGWTLECAAAYWAARAVGIDVSFLETTFVFCFAILVGALSMLPGGLGSAEATMIGLFVAFGASPQTALAGTLLIRVITLWSAVAIGSVVLPIALRRAHAQGVASA